MWLLFFVPLLFTLVNGHRPSCQTCACLNPSFGNVGFRNGSGFVELEVPSYPEYLTIAEEAPQNFGFVQGTSLHLVSSGILVLDKGYYDVTLEVVLFGTENVTIGPIEFNIFGVLDGTYDPDDVNVVGSSNTINPGQVLQYQGSNTLYIQRGQTLTLVINNGVGAVSAPVRMFAWGINIVKLSADVQ